MQGLAQGRDKRRVSLSVLGAQLAIVQHQAGVPAALHHTQQVLYVRGAVGFHIEHIAHQSPVGIAARNPVTHHRHQRRLTTLSGNRQLRHVTRNTPHRADKDAGHIDFGHAACRERRIRAGQRKRLRLSRNPLRYGACLHHHHRSGQRVNRCDQHLGVPV